VSLHLACWELLQKGRDSGMCLDTEESQGRAERQAQFCMVLWALKMVWETSSPNNTGAEAA